MARTPAVLFLRRWWPDGGAASSAKNYPSIKQADCASPPCYLRWSVVSRQLPIPLSKRTAQRTMERAELYRSLPDDARFHSFFVMAGVPLELQRVGEGHPAIPTPSTSAPSTSSIFPTPPQSPPPPAAALYAATAGSVSATSMAAEAACGRAEKWGRGGGGSSVGGGVYETRGSRSGVAKSLGGQLSGPRGRPPRRRSGHVACRTGGARGRVPSRAATVKKWKTRCRSTAAARTGMVADLQRLMGHASRVRVVRADPTTRVRSRPRGPLSTHSGITLKTI